MECVSCILITMIYFYLIQTLHKILNIFGSMFSFRPDLSLLETIKRKQLLSKLVVQIYQLQNVVIQRSRSIDRCI